jgi:hypothetical protein
MAQIVEEKGGPTLNMTILAHDDAGLAVMLTHILAFARRWFRVRWVAWNLSFPQDRHE